MKGVLVILDGVGDLPHKLLGDKTPLEAANTPNLDFLAARGELGYLYTVKPGFAPSSEAGVVSIFGNDWSKFPRGPLSAMGSGIEIKKGDLSFRANFTTIDSFEKGNIIDRRAGRTLTSAEARELSRAINNIKLDVDFEFQSTVQHRAALVFRGNLSESVSGNDMTYTKGKASTSTKIVDCVALDKKSNSIKTAEIINKFLRKVYEVLKEHPVNKKRKARGLMPANFILIRAAGIGKPKLKQYRKWVALGYMPLEKGISKSSGMGLYEFDYPDLKGIDSYKNLWDGLKKACKNSIKCLKKNQKKYDYCYLHLKETDVPGHDNKPIEKKMMIEYIDKTVFKFLRNFAPSKRIKVAVAADHSTVCKLKEHTSDPVPVLLYGDYIPREKRYNERECKKGKLGKVIGKDFLKKIGFDR